MTHGHEFPTSVRLLEVGTLDVVVEFHDPDNGVLIGDEIVLPAPNRRQARLKSARAHGSFGVGARLFDDGILVVPITIQGATWAQVQTRYVALYEALISADEFFVEVTLSGATTRWYCDAPVDVFPAPINAAARVINGLDYELRFTVQPRPTVTIGA
jgi:hypothetical protein